MTKSSILVISASLRPGSYNSRLADIVAKRLQSQGGSVSLLNLEAYPLAIYDARIEAESIPTAAIALQAEFARHDGIFIATPEYNSGPPPLLVNMLDWVSRVTANGGMTAAFGRPVFALGAASPGAFGGYRALSVLRQMLELGFAARVLPEMVSVPAAHEAFDETGELRNERVNGILTGLAAKLLAATSEC